MMAHAQSCAKLPWDVTRKSVCVALKADSGRPTLALDDVLAACRPTSAALERIQQAFGLAALSSPAKNLGFAAFLQGSETLHKESS
ncbi:MAG: hypothetical protein EOP14_01855 [Pseudomonas sp.]|nr:MAG: hypothetical protein EOP14_01855 [Pseudomonas sp.]